MKIATLLVKNRFEVLKFSFLFLLFFSPFQKVLAQGVGDSLDLYGKWQLIPDESSSITYYKTISLDIKKQDGYESIIMKWEAFYPKTEILHFKIDGKSYSNSVKDRVWPFQVFSGVTMIPGLNKMVAAKWTIKNKSLKVEEKYPVLVSQGKVEIKSVRDFSLSKNRQILTLTISPGLDSSSVKKYVFRRGIATHAYYMTLKKSWEVKGLLSENAVLISLQGVVNLDSANLYFIYPEDYDYHFTPKVFDFYKNHLGYSFTEIKSTLQAIKIFKPLISGYIIWDKEARTSLNVAFTLAGLKKAVVVTSDMVPMMDSLGLNEVADLRNKFRGKTDAEVYKWAFEKYWNKCNKKYIIWMGGVSGSLMMPGIADFGISEGCFFTDLSANPKDTLEYALAGKILSKMKPNSMVVGWHSYAKDLERQFVALTSHYGLRVEGLNTFPDLSFTSRTPPPPDFQFKNNHNLVKGKVYQPENKVYITCVQTDGLGLGAWKDKERGSIPYAWEVTMNWQWMAPVLLEYYYINATKNDYFFGGLSGPGYMYPKAVPDDLLPGLIKLADTLMHKLDLNVFETMDYSEGSTLVGNTELPEKIVDAYYKYMPDAIGFLNGYAPAFTFTSKQGRSFISYDYYLDQNQAIADAVSDLKDLIALNKKRPYFLVLHVREYNSIKRVKEILAELGSSVEVVPLDVFMKLAGNKPTFKERFLQEK